MERAGTQDSKAKRSDLRIKFAGEQLLLESVELDETLGQPFAVILDVISELTEIDLLPQLGKEAGVAVHKDGALQRHIHGYVVGGELRDTNENGFRYRLTLAPFTYFMDQNRTYSIHEDASAKDIIERIFAKHAAKVDYTRLQKSYAPREYCVQYAESDFAFVSRLMEEEGIYYFWKHDASGHTMVLCDAPHSHEAGTPGGLTYNPMSLTVFNADVMARTSHSTKAWIHSWNQRAVSGAQAKVALRDYDFKRDAQVDGQEEAKKAHDRDTIEQFFYPGGFVAPSDGDQSSAIMLETLRAQRVVLTGDTQVASLVCGTKVTIDQHHSSWMNGEFLIVRTYHSITAESYRTGAHEQEDPFNVRIEAIPAETRFHAPANTPRPVVKGLETAIVVDGEAQTDAWGRVKVRFNWDRENKSSCWVRVSQTGGLGNIIMPRIGHEVLVDFLDGNPDRPLVVGRVFNASQMPVYALSGNWTRAVWRSRSTGNTSSRVDGSIGNGNELSFEDKAGAEEVFLHASKDMRTRINDKETHHVGTDQEVLIHQNQKIDVKKSIKIDAGTTIDITAVNKITLKVGMSKIVIDPTSITLEATQIKIDGKATVDAQAVMTTVKASGILTLQGSLVKIN